MQTVPAVIVISTVACTSAQLHCWPALGMRI
jgi:hypothetical protein